jgi:hypothetical protein
MPQEQSQASHGLSNCGTWVALIQLGVQGTQCAVADRTSGGWKIAIGGDCAAPVRSVLHLCSDGLSVAVKKMRNNNTFTWSGPEGVLGCTDIRAYRGRAWSSIQPSRTPSFLNSLQRRPIRGTAQTERKISSRGPHPHPLHQWGQSFVARSPSSAEGRALSLASHEFTFFHLPSGARAQSLGKIECRSRGRRPSTWQSGIS